jgi:hypothetical protein
MVVAEDRGTSFRIWFYINAIQEGNYKTMSNSSAINTGSAQVELGHSYNGTYFDGWIHGAKFWNGLDRYEEARYSQIVARISPATTYLSGYWQFDDQDGTDSTSNDNDLLGSGSPTYENDVPFDFYAEDSFVSCTFSSNEAYITDIGQTGLEPTTEFTIEGWFMPNIDWYSAGTTFPLFTKWSSTASECSYRWIAYGGTTYVRLELQVRVGSTTYQKYVDTWTTKQQDQWYHLAVTCKKGGGNVWDIKFYVDGSQQGSTQQFTDSGTLNSGNAQVELADDESGNSGRFQADEVRFWSVERTASEIADNKDVAVDSGSTNLEGYWQFEAFSLDDSTSNSNDLTASGTPTYRQGSQWIPAELTKGQSCVEFDENDSEYLKITDANQTGLEPTTAFTIEAWVYWIANPDPMPIMSKWSVTVGEASYVFQKETSALRLYVRVGSTSEDESVSYSSSGLRWHHLAVTCKEGASNVWDVKFYLNGVQTGATQQFTNAGTINNGNADVLIGTDSGLTNYCDGRVDELRFWNVERSASEILANFQKRVDPGSSGLQAYWSFDKSLLDLTDNDNDLSDGGNGFHYRAGSGPHMAA